MDELPEKRSIPDAAVEAIVEAAAPSWEVLEVTPAERGFCAVYHVEVSDGTTSDTLYLKASPDDDDWSIPMEARLQGILREHTSIPVPEVVSVTDDHDDRPTPYYLMGALPGAELEWEDIGGLSDDVLRRIARETGEYLGELHSVPGVDRYGAVWYDDSPLVDERPRTDPELLTVRKPRDDWATYFRARVDYQLDRHADTPFSNLTPDLRRWFDAGIDALEGPFEAVLGRNDHGLHNVLLDPDTGEITGMLDWGYTLAVTPAFDFEYAVYLFSGAFLAGLPDVPDRRSLVREAMLAGYRQSAPDRADRLATPEPLYEALIMVRVMNDFHHLRLPDGSENAARKRVVADARELLD